MYQIKGTMLWRPEDKTPLGVSTHVTIGLPGEKSLHVINLHLKSFPPTRIQGQIDPDESPNGRDKWLSHGGWSEGFFISSIKRVGQALEARILLDEIFADEGNNALIVIGGDFNAEIGAVPFKTIVGRVENTYNVDLRSSVLVPC
jgi:endonuclease/exonuclease/phosphatase family metal-dependent hydrolase